MDIRTLLDETAHQAPLHRINERLAELLEAIEETGGSGQIAITVKVKREGKHAGVHISCKATIPEEPLPSGIFYLHKGVLHKDDPRQTTLDEAVRRLEPIAKGE